MGILIGLSACVQVTAPDKPIVINLNINIKQEVVYRLDGDAKDLINEEADIF
ncbi:YnbE family lipoprotein [Sphingorhabdus sp. SMR4y]|uniref:YnbE family lipoprotein n=1 Tax=Sphingorhabdus sp. SMR4y TaxID=2584094 RepID=UPI0021B36BF8|nr:YnbE family lipoprotein [Sphingorhabdus sp. SMR4y]